MTEESLFDQALQLSADERDAFLDRVCPDPLMRARVEALLAADAVTRSPLDSLSEKTSFSISPEPKPRYAPEAEGTIIAGRYKLRQQIGEGGMGTVWMADQTEPVKRKVAVKLIRVERGVSKTILTRFEAERQAIALMDHPHIAKLLDAGTTETGSPFFVMELVKGVPLTVYCDTRKFTIAERLNLFTQICSAVQHAHQKGIIHRDLKPSNILVESHDGKPVPKVIDFGLAKATTGLKLSEQTMDTAFGSVMGTPLYMAPEQATFNALDVDTRADVYALGVILYELLTGTTPLTRETVKNAALDEMLRLVREQEAPTPSSRLSSAESAPSVAASRQTEPAKLGHFLKGELDWIVMKALSKERDRRYETANGFAKDIERFLNHEPVQAGPPSASYRFRKFVQRHKGQVIAASLVLFALLAGVVGTTLGLLEARRQTEFARSEAQAKEVARRDAEEQANIAQAVSHFLQWDLLSQADVANQAVAGERDPDITVQALVDRAGQKIEGRFAQQPMVEATIRRTLGNTYRSLGKYDKAVAQLDRAVALFSNTLGQDHLETLQCQHDLAWAHRSLGHTEQAEELFIRVIQARERLLGSDHVDTCTSRGDLAWMYRSLRRTDEAEKLFKQVLQVQSATLEPEDPRTLTTKYNLAGIARDRRQFDLAKQLIEEVLEGRIRTLGIDHPQTLSARNALALVFLEAGKHNLAEPILLQVIKDKTLTLGAEHFHTLNSQHNLAIVYREQRKDDLAERLFQDVLNIQTRTLGADHPDTLKTKSNLANLYWRQRRFDLAEPLFADSLVRAPNKPTIAHPDTQEFYRQLIDIYERTNRPAQAETLWQDLVRFWKSHTLPNQRSYLQTLNGLGHNLLKQQKQSEAVPILRECLALGEKTQPDVWSTFNTQSMLGQALLGEQKYADAEPLLVKGYEGMKAREKTIPSQRGIHIPEALDRLIELYTATNKPDELKKYQELRAKYPTPKEVAPMQEKK